MAKIVLTMNDHRLEALAETMWARGVSVERCMQEQLNQLYSAEVPFSRYQKAERRIKAEQAGRRPETEAPERKFPLLEGKGVLQPENAVFKDYFSRNENLLTVRLVVNPSLCDILGVHDNIWKPGGLINAFIDYDMESGQLVTDMEVTLRAGEEKTETFLHPLTPEEVSMLLPGMDEHIKKWSGMDLAECTDVYRQEVSAEKNGRENHRRADSGKKRKKPPKER